MCKRMEGNLLLRAVAGANYRTTSCRSGRETYSGAAAAERLLSFGHQPPSRHRIPSATKEDRRNQSAMMIPQSTVRPSITTRISFPDCQLGRGRSLRMETGSDRDPESPGFRWGLFGNGYTPPTTKSRGRKSGNTARKQRARLTITTGLSSRSPRSVPPRAAPRGRSASRVARALR